MQTAAHAGDQVAEGGRAAALAQDHAGDHVAEGGRAVVQLEADSVAVDEGVDHVLGKEHDPWRAHGQDAPPLPVITIVINVANIMGEFEARRRTLLCVRVSRAAAQVSCY